MELDALTRSEYQCKNYIKDLVGDKYWKYKRNGVKWCDYYADIYNIYKKIKEDNRKIIKGVIDKKDPIECGDKIYANEMLYDFSIRRLNPVKKKHIVSLAAKKNMLLPVQIALEEGYEPDQDLIDHVIKYGSLEFSKMLNKYNMVPSDNLLSNDSEFLEENRRFDTIKKLDFWRQGRGLLPDATILHNVAFWGDVDLFRYLAKYLNYDVNIIEDVLGIVDMGSAYNEFSIKSEEILAIIIDKFGPENVVGKYFNIIEYVGNLVATADNNDHPEIYSENGLKLLSVIPELSVATGIEIADLIYPYSKCPDEELSDENNKLTCIILRFLAYGLYNLDTYDIDKLGIVPEFSIGYLTYTYWKEVGEIERAKHLNYIYGGLYREMYENEISHDEIFISYNLTTALLQKILKLDRYIQHIPVSSTYYTIYKNIKGYVDQNILNVIGEYISKK